MPPANGRGRISAGGVCEKRSRAATCCSGWVGSSRVSGAVANELDGVDHHTARMRVSSTLRLIDSIAAVSGILDHPHARVMTARSVARAMCLAHTSLAFPRRASPGLCKSFRPKKRAQGMPGARCTRGLVCKVVRRNAHEHTGSAEAIRHSPRNGFTAYAVLSPATNSSCHRHRRIGGFARPGWACNNLRRFDTSNGCQNHTVLPYAATSLVLRRKQSLTAEAALRSLSRATLPRPPHPALHVS